MQMVDGVAGKNGVLGEQVAESRHESLPQGAS
jgi:hypothetical protein